MVCGSCTDRAEVDVDVKQPRAMLRKVTAIARPALACSLRAMDRAPPTLAEPVPEPSAGGAAGRRVVAVMLALLVALGGWLRFSDRIAGWIPSLAPLAASGGGAAGNGQVSALLELGLIPASAGLPAVRAMNLPRNDELALAQAVERRRLRLVQVPLFERDGGTGAVVQVDANGLTRIVRLATQPVVLTVPMAQVGSLRFRLLDAAPGASLGDSPGASPGNSPGGVGIGAITLTGPAALPTLRMGQELDVGVIAQ